MDMMANASSMPKPRALHDVWMERLFQLMEDRYGSLWADRYGAFPRARVMQTWAEDLGDMTRAELVRGVDACKTRKFPPTLPEFRELCRPQMSPEDAFHEAVEQMRMRPDGRDQWTSAAVFWAAVAMGNDLMAYPYVAIKARWAREIDKAARGIEDGRLPDVVPQRMEALPAPGEDTVTAEDARRRAAELKRRIAETAEALAMPTE